MPRTNPESHILGAELRLGRPDAIARVEAACRGATVGEAARALGVPVRTLQHWIKAWPALGARLADGRTTTGPVKRKENRAAKQGARQPDRQVESSDLQGPGQ